MEDVTDLSHEPMLDHHQSNYLTAVTLVIKFHKKNIPHMTANFILQTYMDQIQFDPQNWMNSLIL